MRTAHLFSLTLIAGAILIARAVSSSAVAPDTSGNPASGAMRDGRPQGRGERRLAHAAPAITPAQAKAAAAYPVAINSEIGANDFRLSDMGSDGNALFGAINSAAAYNSTDKAYPVVWQGGDDTAPLVDDEVEIFGKRAASMPCDCNDPDAITGTAGFNLLVGTPGDDILCGFEGRDLLLGLRGDDCIDGGAGRDLIFGGAGADTIDGGEGFDRIFGGGGTDACRNGEGTFHCNP